MVKRFVLAAACSWIVACGPSRSVDLRVVLPRIDEAISCAMPDRLEGMRITAYVGGNYVCPLSAGAQPFEASGTCDVRTSAVRGVMVVYDLDLSQLSSSGVAPLALLIGAVDLTEKALPTDEEKPVVSVQFSSEDFITNQVQLDSRAPESTCKEVEELPDVWARCYFDNELSGTLHCGGTGAPDNLTRVCDGVAVDC